ncbi:LysM peptidoglycan-binding domain-containing protein [Caldanaerobacter subterraneus]|uniref:LysM peptidoglycan-binding domain-containing protein n=2 Tax=Caldanaerobacter subterraneus TaxID=911092 RepID=A0A7Y2PKS1_9THEO|nr:LysM peptidoglycan-binding domain-containing protein [Caldanaerobacter subterraneus]NNG67269.1 LysM peptidoglycan-binding domain-containing protein [Caldanaerobacter subterraneus]
MITIEIPYVVQPGDTVFSIARKFNTSVDAIITRNNIINPSLIYPGQRLIIPVQGNYYTVQPGDTVYSIAQKFNVPYESIIYINNLSYPYNIYPGQRLFIPGISMSYPPSPVPPIPSSSPCPKYYTVQPGDTLWSIAQKFGISIDELIRANYLVNPGMIYPGQTLIIPCPSTPPVEYPTLRLGDRGPFVVNLQARLKSLGFDPGPIDGIFGPKTEAAVKAYQQSRGLPPTGIVDETTWNALLFATPPAPPPSSGKVYIVKPGESLWTIAQKFNTTVEAILKANPEIKDPNLIYPGQRIIIPTSQQAATSQEIITDKEPQDKEEEK